MAGISFFPTLTPELAERSGCVCGKYDFSYLSGENYSPLQARGKAKIKLNNSQDTWEADQDGLRISKKVVFETPSALFGAEGIFCHGAEMGLCIIWNNKLLTQTGYIMPCNVSRDGERICFSFIHEFKPGEIKGDLTLNTTLYVAKSAENPAPDEQYLMNEAGVTVGVVDSMVLDFGNLNMDFPIKEVCDPKSPLWWLELNQWEDPTQDLFDEDYICLYLNSHYAHCPKVGDTISNMDLLIEIISTVYLMVIQKIQDMGYLNQTLTNNDLQPGSIAQIIYYFYTSCDPALRTESIDYLQRTIHANIERMLKEGDA